MAGRIAELNTLLASDLIVTYYGQDPVVVYGKKHTEFSNDNRPIVPECSNASDFETDGKFIKITYTIGAVTNTIRLFLHIDENGLRTIRYTYNSDSYANQVLLTPMATNRSENDGENIYLYIGGDSLRDIDKGGLWIVGDVDTGIIGG